jgi:enoyl-CoA hydratase
MSIWELGKPVIAQVHGFCLAGGSELATCCDLVYMADDAQMGYPAVRFGVPDNHFHAWFVGMRKAMEMMVTGDSIDGIEATRLGWANGSVPEDQLEEHVLGVARRITGVPPDLVQLNKRVVHRQMEIMGLHTGIRAGSELCALGTHQKSMHAFLKEMSEKGLTEALQERDAPFGDYRTEGEGSGSE